MTESNSMTKSEHPELGKLAGSDGLASAMNDNYPVLVTTASLTSLREQAAHLRGYLADDANAFGGDWLEEQQRRLQAVYSYVKDRVLRAEVSQCQRLIELRIGEWLGPALDSSPGRGKSLPGKDINDRHKHEFRLLAENKAVCLAILEKYEGKPITRAALLAEIRDSVLREQSPTQWSEDEMDRRERVEAGITVVATLRGARDKYLLNWAKSKGLLVRIDRGSPWGNPFEMPDDGSRDTVCDRYILHHLPYQPALLNKHHSLKGRVLACWCYPERCHGDYLAEWANKDDPENFILARQLLGIVAKFRELNLPDNLARVLAGLKDHEKLAFFANLRVIGDWIDSAEQIKETVPGIVGADPESS
jgi:hypothetical protein